MTDRRFIKPVDGLTVRDPFHADRPLPPYGAGVEWNSYWQRRFDQADIEATTEEAVNAAELAASPPAAPEKPKRTAAPAATEGDAK